jgi:hypothetical protein
LHQRTETLTLEEIHGATTNDEMLSPDPDCASKLQEITNTFEMQPLLESGIDSDSLFCTCFWF